MALPPNNGPADVAEAFEMLPPHPAQPSRLDQNPRYLHCARFRSRFLPGERDVTVYLPAAYITEPARRFPVFYLQDGQNLIDERTSYVPGRTWQADRTADALTEAGVTESVILVGIANMGARRIAEYTHTRDLRHGGGAGPRYGRMLVEELKPLVDASFRTLPDAANTALGGSSLGGLVALHLALDYPQVFGKVAVCSPSVWWNRRSILERVGRARPKPDLRIWLDMGTAEGLRHLRDTDLLHRRFQQRGWRDGVDLDYLRAEGARHEESAWAARFDRVLGFLFPRSPV